MFRNKPVVSILLKYCGVATIALCITSVAQGEGIGGGVDNIPFKPLAGAMTFGDEYKVFVDYEAISGPVIYRDDVSDEEQEGYDLSSSLRVSGEWRRLVHDYQKEDTAYSVIDHIKRGLEDADFETVYQCQGSACGDTAGWSLYLSSDIIGMNETQHYILCRTPSSNGGYWLVAAYVNDIGYIPRSIVDIVQTRPDSGKAMQIARHLLKDPAPFQFATGSDIVINKNPDELMKLARYLDDHPGQAIEITGHADSTGDATFNNELSARRAKNVSQLLVAAYGIDQSQLNIRAMGEQSPIVRNETEEGLRLNRRVELRIKPMLKGEQ